MREPLRRKASITLISQAGLWPRFSIVTDADVVDIVHVTALFNYMCRVADGLGVELQPDRGWEAQAPELSFQGDTAPRVFRNITSAPTTTAV